ncbi:PAS domain S-box protein [Lutibacter citreus]|uniref:PAS domain S-box protein n=1 Tax=Lutibacter citreus TaxID=2138210 RepID=UPI000DBE816F|nr:PAS domain S-box protein [Lutibacter citreus]
MPNIYFDQILFLIFQSVIVAFLLLSLFRLRTVFGLSLLLTVLGVFQYMQVFLANTLYFEIIEGIYVSSGSSILFTGSLFAILMVYIKEDTQEARKLIYAIISANIALIILQGTISLGFNEDRILNIYNLPRDLFTQNFRISVSGALLLFIDAFLIIFIYEFVSKYTKFLFLRILITTITILSLDSIAFAFLAFYGTGKAQRILIAGLVSKNIAAIIYTIIFTLYLKYNEKKESLLINNHVNAFKDIFHTLTFRQKYEHIYEENISKSKELKENERRFKTLVEQASDAYFVHNYNGNFVDVNERACKSLGYTRQELLTMNVADIETNFNLNKAQLEWAKTKQNAPSIFYGNHKNKNGSSFPVEINFGVFSWKNEMLYFAQARDITIRLQKELDIKRYALIVESSLDMIAFLDENFNYLTVNDAYAKAFNLTKNKIIGFNALNVFGKDFFEHIIKPEADRCLNGEYVKSKKWVKFPASEDKYMDARYTPFYNENKKITGFIVNVRDITDSKIIQDKLKEEKNKAQNYLNVAGVMLLSINTEGIIQMINPKGCEILGYNEDEIVGKNWFDNFIPKLNSNNIKEVLKKIKKGNIEELKHYENEILTKDGNKRLIAWTNVLILDDQGNIKTILSSGEDITQRKKTEEILIENEAKYRTLFEYAPEGILIANADGNYIDANTAICKMLGLTHKELIGLNASNIIIPTEIEHIEPALDIINSDNSYFRVWQFKRKDNSIFSAEVSVTPMPNGNLLALVKDITERKELETELLNEKTQLKAIIDNIPILITLYNPEINLLFLNKEFEKKLEITAKEASQIDFMKLFYPDKIIREQAIDFMDKAPNEWKEFPVSSTSGKIKNVEWTNIKLKNGTQIGIGLDITEKKKTENDLNKTKDMLLNTLENMNDGFVSLDYNSNYIFVNKKASNLLGKNSNNLLNKNMWDVFPEAINQPIHKNIHKALETQKPIVFEAYSKTLNIWVENRLIPSKNGISIFFQNITEKQIAKEKLIEYNNRLKILHDIDSAILNVTNINQIADNVLNELKKIIPFSHISITEYSKDIDAFKFISVNTIIPDFKLPLHIIPASNFNFLDFNILFKGKTQIIEDLSKHNIESDLVKKAVDFGLKSFMIFPLISENIMVGTLAVFSKSMKIFTDSNVQIIREIGNQLAILIQQNNLKSEILKYTEDLEEKIKERTAQLEFSNGELRDFAQIVSHDLKAPLRAISQLSYWVSEDYSDKIDAEGKEYLKMLVSRVKRMDDLIEGVLQYSRAGKAREKEIAINLDTIVNDVITDLNPPNNITITLENTLPQILGDPTRFGQLFQNLINNAIKFNNKPKGIINIGCKQVNKNWQFYVSDNGPGIEEKYFDRIFQIFQRLESRDNQEGTGVGLTLVKRILQIYGGKIWIESEIDKGTIFFFTLPINK